MKTFADFVTEENEPEALPPMPGETPIPDGHIRLYHQTSEDRANEIEKHGIDIHKAQGVEGPKGVWADPHGFYGKPSEHHTVEFHVPKHEWHGAGPINRSIHRHEIIAVHHPWHGHARYMLNDPETLASVHRGEFDYLRDSPEYRHAIDYVKKRH